MIDESVNFQSRQEGPLHSTPIKGSKLNVPVTSSSQSAMSQRSQDCTACDVEAMTMQKQRQEIQLLVNELHDRDRELTEMVSSHQQQLQAWEQDRQHMLALEKKCARFENELTQVRRQLDETMSQLNMVVADQQSHCSALESTSLQLEAANRSCREHAEKVRELQLQNQTLNESVRERSTTLGRLEAREQELTSVLREKEAEIADNNRIISELHKRMAQMESEIRQFQQREADTMNNLTQWKNRYNDLKREYEKASGELVKKEENLGLYGRQYEEAMQQINALKEALLLSEEREKYKGEVVESLKTKQERVENELRGVRQLYERQQRELAMLYLNLDSSRELSLNNSNKDSGEKSQEDQTKESDSSLRLEKGFGPERAQCPHNYLKSSFEDRLNTFLDPLGKAEDLPTKVASSDSNDANDQVDADGSLGPVPSRLQKLLLQSSKLIKNLEETSISSLPQLSGNGGMRLRHAEFDSCRIIQDFKDSPSAHKLPAKSSSGLFRLHGDANQNCSLPGPKRESPHHPDSDIEASPPRD